MANVTNNIFYFDLDDKASFYAIKGCAYSCSDTSFTQFQNFQGNLYWRTDGGFATYAKAFHVSTSGPSNPSQCPNLPANWTFFGFSQWQSGSPPPGSTWGPRAE